MIELLILEKEVKNEAVYLSDLQKAFNWTDRETIENIDEAIASELIELHTMKSGMIRKDRCGV
jgi:hypothetical protein